MGAVLKWVTYILLCFYGGLMGCMAAEEKYDFTDFRFWFHVLAIPFGYIVGALL